VELNKLFNDINNNMIGSSCLASSLGYDGSAECIPIILYYLDHNIRWVYIILIIIIIIACSIGYFSRQTLIHITAAGMYLYRFRFLLYLQTINAYNLRLLCPIYSYAIPRTVRLSDRGMGFPWRSPFILRMVFASKCSVTVVYFSFSFLGMSADPPHRNTTS